MEQIWEMTLFVKSSRFDQIYFRILLLGQLLIHLGLQTTAKNLIFQKQGIFSLWEILSSLTGKEGLISTLSILIGPEGWISWSIPWDGLMMMWMSVIHPKLWRNWEIQTPALLGNLSCLRKSLGRRGWISEYIPCFGGAQIQYLLATQTSNQTSIHPSIPIPSSPAYRWPLVAIFEWKWIKVKESGRKWMNVDKNG